MTLEKLLRLGADKLSKSGISEADLDARYLLLSVTGISPAMFLIRKNQEADGETEQRFEDLIQRRASRIPLQHILGTQEFMGLEFAVSPDVLIPRQDTETLVERVLYDRKGIEGTPSLLDMCTGSGCIALSLAVLGDFGQVVAADISPKALIVAEENARRLLPRHRNNREDQGAAGNERIREHGKILNGRADRFQLLQSDLYENIPADMEFDIIVSNPPYIPSQDIRDLEPEVKDYEPRLALDGSADGLEFYRRLAAESGAYLKPGGRIYLEIGYDQGLAVSSLLRAAGFINIEIIKDIPGQDRVVAARWPQEGTHV